MSLTSRLAACILFLAVSGAGGIALVRGQAAPSAPAAPAGAGSAFKPTPGVIPYVRGSLPELKSLKPAVVDPRTADDLKAIEERVEIISRHALPAIVNIQIQIIGPDGIQGEQGSGIIVSKDGYVLTAGHVSGNPGQAVTMVLSNGTRVGGVTLGANTQFDSGMIKITSRPDAEFPFMPLGSIAGMRPGEWVMAMGHPGGLQTGRAPVVRLGKVLAIADRRTQTRPEFFIQTDCPLIMGDSGGPVFDLEGRVIGINSKIGVSTTSNIHVPVDTFIDTWDRLASGEKWNSNIAVAGMRGRSGQPPQTPLAPPAASLSASVKEESNGIRVLSVRADRAAEKAGISAGDIISKIDGTIVKTFDDLRKLLSSRKPGDQITIDLLSSGSPQNAKPRQVRVTLDAADR